MGKEVAVAIGAQARHAGAVDLDGLARLGARLDIDGELFAIELVDGEVGAQGGVNHRHAHGEVQVISIALEDGVLLRVDLNVQVTGRTAAVADLALGCHTDAHTIVDAGRDINGNIATLLHAAVAGAVVAWIGDDLAKALALRARAGGHNVAQEAALHLLDFTHAIAVITGNRLGLGLGTGTATAIAQHRGIHGDLLLQAGIGLFQGNASAQQGIIARLDAGLRAAGAASTAAKELGEDIAQATAAEAAKSAGTGTSSRRCSNWHSTGPKLGCCTGRGKKTKYKFKNSYDLPSGNRRSAYMAADAIETAGKTEPNRGAC